MTNYHFLAKSYDADRTLLRGLFNDLVEHMISSKKDSTLHHYFEPVTKEIYQLGNRLEFYKDIGTTDLSIDHVNLFICKAYKIGGLHMDSAKDPRFVSMNIPLLEDDRSEMLWVDPNQYKLGSYDVRGRTARAGYPDADELNIDAWNVIDRTTFSRPMVIKVNSWHSVDNRFNPNPRVALAIRFAKNPTFEEFTSEFQKKGLIGGG